MHVELHCTPESDVNILCKQILIEICAAHVATERVVCSSSWPKEQQCSGESQVANDGPGCTGDPEGRQSQRRSLLAAATATAATISA